MPYLCISHGRGHDHNNAAVEFLLLDLDFLFLILNFLLLDFGIKTSHLRSNPGLTLIRRQPLL